ncbi:MAG TPA: hypothetical protein VK640_12310 [Actinomycetes bacterium]|nr:hypothetical protein [Actinomycetes bacterium]
MKRLAPVVAAAAIGVGLAASGLPSQGQEDARPAPSRGDLTAAAVAAPDSPDVVDEATSTLHAARGHGDVDTAASANAGCDGCSATATALHIVYLDRSTEATVDNVTVAWSECRNCSATAVSVQVVILRSPQTVRVNNRALAVNAACAGCRTAAAAYQLVMVGERRDRLAAADIEELRRWIADQVVALRAVAPTGGSAAPAASTLAPLGQLEVLVGERLGGATTLRRDADVRTGVTEATPEPPPQEGQPTQPPPSEPSAPDPSAPLPEGTTTAAPASPA